jgi:hypothetical protein
MRNLLSFLVLTEVFEQNTIPVIPFLMILLVCSPYLLAAALVKKIFWPEVKRAKFPEEIADEALLESVRKGMVPADSYEVRQAEQRVYFSYYELKAIDEGLA